MKAYAIVTLLILIINSCGVSKNIQNIEGNYLTKGKNMNHYLEISSDSTFIYSIGYSGSLISKCSGKWKLNNEKDSIELFCEDQELLESLTSTYMSKRLNKFRISKNKLIYEKLSLYKN